MKFHQLISCLFVLVLFCGCGGGGGSTSTGAAAATNPAADPEVASETEYVSFSAYDFVRERYYTVSASKVAEGEHCYIYLQKDQDVAQDAIERVKNEYDTVIYPSLKGAFGDEPNPGVDGDRKIFILLLKVLDGFSEKNTSYIAGYFDPTNEYDIPPTNKKELIYMNINPAPGIVVGNEDFNDTLAHEFQHMIHWQQKTYLKKLVDDTWLDEAMSTVAGTYCGYGPSWYHVWIYEQDPSNSLVTWDSEAEDYGVAYMWAQYFKDHYNGSGNIFKLMLDQNSTGITSVNSALSAAKYSKNFSETFRDLSIAVFSGNRAWLGHTEWSYTSIDTGPGVRDGFSFPGLFPGGSSGVTSLPVLGAYSMGFYLYSATAAPNHTVTWTQAGANNYASFIRDDIPDITFTMNSGQAYDYVSLGYVIEQQLEGSSGGGTVVSSSVVRNAAKLADTEISAALESGTPRSSRQILSGINESSVVKRFVSQKGKKFRIHMDSFFREREKELRKSGARPAF
ncbi:MAG: hypothetical protein EG822_08565 [Deltaproteobacteria bacterium]|nr:hypothetical protein [Deltaproteobacteria bacterium]TLN03428.1 MAG: hypothetical protein FDZ73_07650 [bacterium]